MSLLALALVVVLDQTLEGAGLQALDEERYEDAARLLGSCVVPSYDGLVGLGQAEARRGQKTTAAEVFARAIELEPDRSEAFVERGGLHFLESRYDEAVSDLERALARREDPYARDLLATSLHLLDRPEEALASWNQLSGPMLSRIEIAGLRRTHDSVARRELRLREGETLDLAHLRESRRRLLELGIFDRVTLRPEPRGDGTADLEVAVSERHGLAGSPLELALASATHLASQRVLLRYSNLRGSGVSVAGSYRFDRERPEASLRLAWPRPLGLDANLHLGAWRNRQPYVFDDAGFVRFAHGLDVTLRRVAGSDTIVEMGYAYRHRVFAGSLAQPVDTAGPSSGAVAGVLGGVEHRFMQTPRHTLDGSLRLFIAGRLAGSDVAFGRGVSSLRYEARLDRGPEKEAKSSLVARVLWGTATSGQPRDEGFAPGGSADAGLPLRGRRQIFEDDRGTSPLGRSLALLNVEWRKSLLTSPGLRFSSVFFYDGARLGETLGRSRMIHDVGVGLRMGVGSTVVRIDWGHGLTDGSSSFSFGLGQAF